MAFYPQQYQLCAAVRGPFAIYNRWNVLRPFRHHSQEFDYLVVIDFEATCDRGKPPSPQEIIEFPSVIVSSWTGKIVASFQTYVRPTCNPVLTDFCKDLTGIQQAQVDQGVTLSAALDSHDQWLERIGVKNTNFAIVTWTDWDCQVMLESECNYKHIDKPSYFNRWINLKVPFGEMFGRERCNLKQAVERAGLTWEGRAHCGLDDAKNTARLVVLMMKRGLKLAITNSLPSKDNDDMPKPFLQMPKEPVPYALVPLVPVVRGVFVPRRNWIGPSNL